MGQLWLFLSGPVSWITTAQTMSRKEPGREAGVCLLNDASAVLSALPGCNIPPSVEEKGGVVAQLVFFCRYKRVQIQPVKTHMLMFTNTPRSPSSSQDVLCGSRYSVIASYGMGSVPRVLHVCEYGADPKP